MKTIIRQCIERFLADPTGPGTFAVGRGNYQMTWDSCENTVTIMSRPSYTIVCEGNNPTKLAEAIIRHSEKGE
jgi:hypothetical protein